MTPEQFIKLMEDPVFAVVFTLIAIWGLVWKGFALWRAGRNYQKIWFIVLLVANTVGILEILYIFCFSKKGSCCGKGKEITPSQTPQP